MKRSEINARIEAAMERARRQGVCLPPFSRWTPEDWVRRGRECDEIRENMLGWDVTDYGHGDFGAVGLLLFTLRNGNLRQPRYAKAYAEKMLLSEPDQLSPNHYHWHKMEDIINRGGGDLRVQVWNAAADDSLAESDVAVRMDGWARTVPAGTVLRLAPGESITIPPRLYHAFWAERETVLAWEVSMVNDDNTDNRFYEEQLRFTRIEEDEPVRHLLCNEYPKAR
jgi:D-lyxose ketol-isomerase